MRQNLNLIWLSSITVGYGPEVATVSYYLYLPQHLGSIFIKSQQTGVGDLQHTDVSDAPELNLSHLKLAQNLHDYLTCKCVICVYIYIHDMLACTWH